MMKSSEEGFKQYIADVAWKQQDSVMHQVRDAAERVAIDSVSKRCCGNVSKMAELLGIDRKTLRKKVQQYELQQSVFDDRATLAKIGLKVDSGLSTNDIGTEFSISSAVVRQLASHLSDARQHKLFVSDVRHLATNNFGCTGIASRLGRSRTDIEAVMDELPEDIKQRLKENSYSDGCDTLSG